jgi:hypothetical protein
MKIKPEDLVVLKEAISKVDTIENRQLYISGKFSRADRVKDINMRYRWDMLHLCKLRIGDGVGIEGDLNLYSYMNDTHIDTALKSIIKPLD